MDFRGLEAKGILTSTVTFPAEAMCPVLSCAANAADITRRQRNALLDAKTELKCPG
jgi:hypothetical protein